MNKKILLKLEVSCAFTFILALFFLSLSGSRFYQTLELKSLDLRFVMRGSRQAALPILHIDIDDQSLEKLGRWPWPRVYHAKLVDTLTECGVRQVLMDVLFMERTKDNPQMDASFALAMRNSGRVYLPFYFPEDQPPPQKQLEELLLKDISVSVEDASGALGVKPEALKDALMPAKRFVMDRAVRELLSARPDISQEELIKELENSRGWFMFPAEETLLAESLQSQKAARSYAKRFAISYPGVREWPYPKTYRSLIPPIPEFAESFRSSGFINADPDLDGVMRRVPLLVRYEDKVLPQLTVAALMDALEVEGIEASKGLIVFKNALQDGARRDIAVPVDKNGCLLINWQGRWGYSFKHLPFHLILQLQDIREQLQQILDGPGGEARDTQEIEYLRKSESELKQKLTGMVEGKICLVGLTATGTQDMGPIPFQPDYPLVGTHANLINTILTGKFIRKAPWTVNALFFFLTALAIGLASLLKLHKSMLLSFGYAAAYFLLAFLVFDKAGLWIDLVGPEGIVIFGFSAITSYRYFTEEKEKLWIKNAFGHYLSQEVINELLNDPSRLKLGGERRNITVLFSDVRGFTRFSESHQPEEVVAMLNEILTQQVEVVFKFNGTLDKFVGDEVMAFFGAPGEIHRKDHAATAVKVAVEIQEKMKKLLERWQLEKKEALHIGIGINTGDMVVGNMGSSEMMDYTVIGDNVNLAARLCSAADKGEILISEATYEAVKDQVEAEKLEPISVKGKSQPVYIYRVRGMRQSG